MKYLLTFLLLFVGCNHKKQVIYPKWYFIQENSSSNGENLYGAGEGDDLKDAQYNALINIASKIKISVNSHFASSDIIDSTGYDRSSAAMREINVNKINLSNYTIMENERLTNGKFVMLIKLNLSEFTKSLNCDIETSLKKVKNLTKKSKISKLHHYSNIKEANRIIDDVVDKQNIIQMIYPKNLVNHEKIIQQTRKLLHNVKKSIEITLVCDDSEICNRMQDLLINNQINIVKSSKLKMNIKSKFTHNYEHSIFFTQLKISFKISENNELVASKTFTLKDSSVSSFDFADKNLLDKLNKRLSGDILEFFVN